jgi:hypothetical protein
MDGRDRHGFVLASPRPGPGGAGVLCDGKTDEPELDALDLRVLRLRRRIAALELEITTVWRRGDLLEAR